MQEADQDRLFACLKQIMGRSAEFGGGTFALAASVLTDLIHHDPMVYASLDKAGLPDAFISSIKVLSFSHTEGMLNPACTQYVSLPESSMPHWKRQGWRTLISAIYGLPLYASALPHLAFPRGYCKAKVSQTHSWLQ